LAPDASTAAITQSTRLPETQYMTSKQIEYMREVIVDPVR
jgi:hypothetical protein